MGSKPGHFPRTEFKMTYDETTLHVMFRVEDRYVRAVAARDQDPVCRDSCVEFFFTPGEDVSLGYFNLEMNCGGTMLFHFQHAPRKDPVEIPVNVCSTVCRAHALPRIVDPEIGEPVTWTVRYGIPVALLNTFCPAVSPRPGVSWRGNFYKCADHTSHPHWLTWAPVDVPCPDFHRPEFFGALDFR